MDIALLASDNDAMPFSLIEARMMGLPAVTTNVDLSAEVIDDGKSVYVFQIDIRSIENELRKFIQSTFMRTKTGDYAREFATFTFRPKNQLGSHLHSHEIALGLKP